MVDPTAVEARLTAASSGLRWTDDTALTLALAEHLVATGGTCRHRPVTPRHRVP